MVEFEDIARQRLSLDERPTEFDPTDEPFSAFMGICCGLLLSIGLCAVVWYGGLWRVFL